MTHTEFLDAVKSSLGQDVDVVNYFHGFKASFMDSVDQVKKIARCYGNSKRQLVLFSWPSKGKLSRKAYQSDRSDARKSGRDAASVLNEQFGQATKGAAAKVHVICQSLGNRVFEYAVSHLKNTNAPLGEVVLSSPVIPRNAFESGQNLEELPETCERVSLYYNPDDFARFFKTFLGETNEMSLKGPAKPLELDDGVAVINCDDVLGLEHRYIYESPDVISDVNMVLDGVDSNDKRLKRKFVPALNQYQLREG